MFLSRWVSSIIFVVVLSQPLLASELIITNPPQSADDKRFEHPKELLISALEHTRADFGDYAIQPFNETLSRNRALRHLLAGQLTVFSAPAHLEWEKNALPIRIPLRKGLMGYRVFLIREENADLFKNITSLDQLKAIPMGLGAQWSTTKALRPHGFNIVTGTDYEGLFGMLHLKRFDYFPRGVNEIVPELEARGAKFPDMMIEENLALYQPLPYYFYVSPTKPNLLTRLQLGLSRMIADGSFDEIFDKHFSEGLEKLALNKRKIFKLENESLSYETPLNHKEFWYNPKVPSPSATSQTAN